VSKYAQTCKEEPKKFKLIARNNFIDQLTRLMWFPNESKNSLNLTNSNCRKFHDNSKNIKLKAI